MDAAKRGYIAYTNCTAALAEVVPFGGKFPTLGTNPHSWGFRRPTRSVFRSSSIGRPRSWRWGGSSSSSARASRCRHWLRWTRTAIPRRIRTQAVSLLPFGAHKGYGLSLINEIVGGFIGGSLPTLRNRWVEDGDKHTCTFFFQVIHPDALNAGAFAKGR
jgi:LDH2 family malate/lactate/ureidoglycolate dehydrogenase